MRATMRLKQNGSINIKFKFLNVLNIQIQTVYFRCRKYPKTRASVFLLDDHIFWSYPGVLYENKISIVIH